MKKKEIKFKNSSQGYSIIIGDNILGILPKKIKPNQAIFQLEIWSQNFSINIDIYYEL